MTPQKYMDFVWSYLVIGLFHQTGRWRGWRGGDVFVWKSSIMLNHRQHQCYTRTHCKQTGLYLHLWLILPILSRFFFTLYQTLVYSNEEESEIPSSHLNFLFITSFNAGRGEEDTLSSIIESFSDQQAVRISVTLIWGRSIRFICHPYSTFPSVSLTEPSVHRRWRISNLLFASELFICNIFSCRSSSWPPCKRTLSRHTFGH